MNAGHAVSPHGLHAGSPPLPLLAPRDLSAPLAWRHGQALSAAAFLAAAQRLAAQLPAHGRPINLCQDRLHFALGLAAALIRGQTSLMPPNALPATLAQLPAGTDAPYVLADSADAVPATWPVITVALGPTAHTSAEAAQPAADDPVPVLDAALAAACLLTSGSTGAPQPHAKRWGQLVLNIGAEAARLAELLDLPSLAGLTLVATVPAQHSYGFESTVLLALLGGANFDAGRPFYPADIAEALAQVPRPRGLVTTPFHLKALLGAGLALPPVDLVLSATAPLSPQLAAQAEAAMGARLVEIYGCTEAGQVAARRTTAGDTWTTLGALRLHREAGPAEGSEDGTAADGPEAERFIVQGGHVTEPTALADVLVLHDERRFQLLGRANDLIHVAGKRSSLAHLNYHLNRMAGVDDGAFWLPEPGSAAAGALEDIVRPVAFVVAPGLSAAQVIAGLRAELEPAFVPRRVVHVDALPREATGKLTAGALQRFALQQLAAAASGTAAPTNTAAPTGITPLAHTAAAPGGQHFEVSADHPAFAGHFPGHPILPGVVLLDFVLQAVHARPELAAALGATPTIDQVKFLAPVGPDSTVVVQLSATASGVGFEVHEAARLLARGRLIPGAP